MHTASDGRDAKEFRPCRSVGMEISPAAVACAVALGLVAALALVQSRKRKTIPQLPDDLDKED